MRAEIATAKAFIAAATRRVLRATAPRKAPFTSYGWKHLAEQWGKQHGLEPYVSNGAFIQAVVEEGIPIRADGSGINAYVALRLARR
ncbi:MAG: hypothetical protein Q8S13_10605 [Dehalococcoidia bacterium]|nr:hypothetical protein [Dehalococcoidia bacterium]